MATTQLFITNFVLLHSKIQRIEGMHRHFYPHNNVVNKSKLLLFFAFFALPEFVTANAGMKKSALANENRVFHGCHSVSANQTQEPDNDCGFNSRP